MERKILNPTIAEKSSHPAIVAKKPLAADVEPVDRGNDDEEEAPPEVEDPDPRVAAGVEAAGVTVGVAVCVDTLVPDIKNPLPIVLKVVQDEDDGAG